MFTGIYAYIQSAKVISSYCSVSPNGMLPTLCESIEVVGGGEGAVCPCSVLHTKDRKVGNTLGFGAKLEGLQLAVTSLCVILCSKDSGLLKQLQEALVFLVFPVTPFE